MLANLNPSQKEAAEYFNGPLLIIAGAGAGKTQALTARIINMIESGIAPSKILAITFTNKAANELKHRIEKYCPQSQLPLSGTFHSICVKILRSEIGILGFDNDFTIYDSQDQLSAVKRVFKNLNIDPKEKSPKKFLSFISKVKNQLLKFNHQEDTGEFERVYTEYSKLLKKNNALDFDDLILFVYQIFSSYPDILEKYQRRWPYVSVDEYQDTNEAQFRFLKLLCAKDNNICVIGDADQSIYSFRGAQVENILNFSKVFPDTKTIKLEKNYRSTKNILSAANAVIQNNSTRIPKNMYTDNEEGEFLQHKTYMNDELEARQTAQEILNLSRNGSLLKDCVVIYRTNAQSRSFEEAFLQYGISYKIIGGLKFYSRKEIKDILAYLRIINNKLDSISLQRIINVPARKIGASSFLKLQNAALTKNIELLELIKHIDLVENLSSAAKNAFRNFANLYQSSIDCQKTRPLSELINFVYTNSGYKEMLKKDGSIESQSRMENIEELIKVGSRYDNFDNSALKIFLEEVALIQDSDEIKENENSVFLMTAHSAKGLEFDNVFIVGLEEDLFPHSQSMFSALEIEEERRLFYVALTRAKKRAYLSNCQERFMFGKRESKMPSRFLEEIPAEYFGKVSAEKSPSYSENRYSFDEDSQMPANSFQEGQTVYHTNFGQGEVISSSQGIITVSFGPGMVKKFAASIAPLQIID